MRELQHKRLLQWQTAVWSVKEMQQRHVVDQTDYQYTGMGKTLLVDHRTTLELSAMDYWAVTRSYTVIQCIQTLTNLTHREGTTGRALEHQQTGFTGQLTIAKCISACKDAGYSYAGAEYAVECCRFSAWREETITDIYEQSVATSLLTHRQWLLKVWQDATCLVLEILPSIVVPDTDSMFTSLDSLESQAAAQLSQAQ